MQHRFRHSIRFKLLLVSLTLLGIPWAGYQFILETEHFLRDAQQHNLQTSAQGIAALLALQAGQFSGTNLAGQQNRRRNLYLNTWQQPPVVDGYADEWEEFKGSFSRYQLPGGMLTTEVALGVHGNQAYLLLRVADTSRHYGAKGDSVELAFGNEQRHIRLSIQPLAPGWVVARHQRNGSMRSEPQVRGEWQETAQGYVLELRLPKNLLGKHFGLAVSDSEGNNRLQTSRLYPIEQVGRLVRPSHRLQELLQKITPPATRTWVLDHEGLVLARSGQLDTDAPLSADEERMPWLVQQLILATLPRQADSEFELTDIQSRIDIATVREALAGRPAGLRRRIPESDAIVVSTAVPIRTPQGVIGGILIEQTTNAILSIQNLALQRLFAVTLLFFIVTSLGLLAFASLLTTRIRRLRNGLERAVSHDGRILGMLKTGRSQDEIGELERGLAAVLNRLGEYNHYLEAMASRLAHELRTPLSVVRTSLDNAAQSQEQQQQHQYLERAHSGAERLETILKRLREATRLEQALQDAEPEIFDLQELLRNQVEAVRCIWPDIELNLELPADSSIIQAVPDLISQAMEKLLSNAVDFHDPGSRITIQVQQKGDVLDLSVINQGPPLPEGVDLFKSMVSARKGKSDQPHLGLGLYLVRLIAEFHHGSVYANNELESHLVRIGIKFPYRPSSRS